MDTGIRLSSVVWHGLLLNDVEGNEIMGELVVLVTASSKEEAVRIADCLVSQRLAACVNILPGIESIYRWQGRIARDDEVLLLIKTTSERFPELELQVKQLHSYSVPEVVAVEIKQGSSAYLKWLRDSTLPDGDAKED